MLIMLAASWMFGSQIFAYSWDYLPSGDNYLDEDAFEFDGFFLSTQEAILIKPNQDYIYTIGVDYYELFDDEEEVAEIEFYNDSSLLFKQYIDCSDFEANGVIDTFSFLFRSPITANRMTISIVDKNLYVSTYFFEQMILEEGVSFDGFEDYVNGTILDTDSPQFSTIGTIYSYVHAPITIEEIRDSLSAYDVIDGDVSDSIEIVEDNYSANLTTIGTYSIVFSVSDNSGNENQTTITVLVIDVLKPVFSNIGTLTIAFPNTFSVSDVLALLSASDNYDLNISSQINLVEDNYTPYRDTVGTYTMTFAVSDSSGNETTYVQRIDVIDDDSPLISGTGYIVIGYDETITMEELLSRFTVSDNYDSEESLHIIVESDSYSANKYILGTYQVKISVTDSCNNKTEKIIYIEVVDEIGPIVYFDSAIIQTYTDQVLSLEDFVNLLVKAKEVSDSEHVSVKVIYDSYTSHASIPGIYHLKINLQTDDGTVLEKELQIVVRDSSSHIINLPEEESFLLQNKEYFIYGSLGFVLIITNLIWFFINRRR